MEDDLLPRPPPRHTQRVPGTRPDFRGGKTAAPSTAAPIGRVHAMASAFDERSENGAVAAWSGAEERATPGKGEGPPGHRRALLAVEMGGVEPPSRIFGRKYPTRLVDVLRAASPPRRQGDAAVSRTGLGDRAPTD